MQNRSDKYLVGIEYVVFLTIMGLALALRTVNLNRGFWEDEAFEYTMCAARPLTGVLDFSPKAYHVFAHFALYLGDEEWNLRLPSLLFGLAGITLLYRLVRMYVSPVMALFAALMLTTSSFHIVASTDARSYTLAIFAALWILYTLEQALSKGGKKRWGLFILAGNFGALSHLFLIPFIFAMAAGAGVWILFSQWRSSWATLMRSIAILMVCVFLCLSTTAITHLHTSNVSILQVISATDTKVLENVTDTSLSAYRLSIKQYLGYYPQYFENMSSMEAFLFIGFSLLGILFCWKKNPRLLCILLGALIVTPIPFFFHSVHHWFHMRYFSPVIPIVIILFVTGLGGVLSSITQALKKYDQGQLTLLMPWLIHGSAILIIGTIFYPLYWANINDIYTKPYGRGLHKEREYKLTTKLIRRHAAPNAMASVLKPRPDWHYYERKVLADYLIEPVKPFEPFELFYLTYNNLVDVNELPRGLIYVNRLFNDDPMGTDIFRYELTPQYLRTLQELSTFSPKNISADVRLSSKKDEPITYPFTITLLDDKATCQLVSEQVMVMPHRYIEWIVELNGPPQFGMLMNFYDDAGNLLFTESRWMRETGSTHIYEESGTLGEDERIVAQREPHPTGASAPTKPIEGDFTLKLSTVTPPCATSMETQLLIRGDTRAGDVYEVHSSMVQGDWGEDEHFIELLPKESNNAFQSFENWSMKQKAERAKGTLIPSTEGNPAEYHLDILARKPEFEFISEKHSVGKSKVLQVDVEFYGDISAYRLFINCYNNEGKLLESNYLYNSIPNRFKLSRQSTIIIPGDNGWSTLRGTTTWLSEDTHYVLLGVASGSLKKLPLKSTRIKLRLPKLYGDG